MWKECIWNAVKLLNAHVSRLYKKMDIAKNKANMYYIVSG